VTFIPKFSGDLSGKFRRRLGTETTLRSNSVHKWRIPHKKNFCTKKPRKVFWTLVQKLGIGSNNNCLWQKLHWRPLSAFKVWWRSINVRVRRQENEKTRVFTSRKAFIKITFVGFWFVAPIIVEFGREELAPDILLTVKIDNLKPCIFWQFLAHPVATIAKSRQFLAWMACAMWFRGSFLPVLHCLSSAMHLFCSFFVTLWQSAKCCCSCHY